jgi:hypothetical protein
MIPKDILEIAQREGKDFRKDKSHPNWIISGHHNKIDDSIKHEIERKGYMITEDHDFSYGYSQYRYQFIPNNCN